MGEGVIKKGKKQRSVCGKPIGGGEEGALKKKWQWGEYAKKTEKAKTGCGPIEWWGKRRKTVSF